MEDDFDFDDLEFPFEASTHGVTVRVCPMYADDDEEESEDASQHTWVYFIQIENSSGMPLTLKNRYWRIVDANGHVQEVHGAGVVGEHPQLDDGDVFEYDSSTTLATSSGFMGGMYEMTRPDGSMIQVTIPTFPLDLPGEIFSLN